MRGMLLAGDIGGTNTRLVLLERGASLDAARDFQVYPSNARPSLIALLEDFLARTGARPEAAAFGVAGPVLDGRARATNLSWVVDAAEIRHALRIVSSYLTDPS